jgi:polyisoprenoid-binding protein YceI
MPQGAGSPGADEIYITRKGTARFISDAPFETIRGASNELRGIIDATSRTFAFSVNNHTIKGFNSPLQQEHFYENYIEADKYPVSTFEGKIIEQVDFTQNGDYTVRAKGKLTIHGVAQERIIRSTIHARNGVLTVESQFKILLADHNITIPKIVFQKIAQEISIEVDAEFTRKNPVTK